MTDGGGIVYVVQVLLHRVSKTVLHSASFILHVPMIIIFGRLKVECLNCGTDVTIL